MAEDSEESKAMAFVKTHGTNFVLAVAAVLLGLWLMQKMQS